MKSWVQSVRLCVGTATPHSLPLTSQPRRAKTLGIARLPIPTMSVRRRPACRRQRRGHCGTSRCACAEVSIHGWRRPASPNAPAVMPHGMPVTAACRAAAVLPERASTRSAAACSALALGSTGDGAAAPGPGDGGPTASACSRSGASSLSPPCACMAAGGARVRHGPRLGSWRAGELKWLWGW